MNKYDKIIEYFKQLVLKHNDYVLRLDENMQLGCTVEQVQLSEEIIKEYRIIINVLAEVLEVEAQLQLADNLYTIGEIKTNDSIKEYKTFELIDELITRKGIEMIEVPHNNTANLNLNGYIRVILTK